MTKFEYDYLDNLSGAEFEKDYILYNKKPSYWKYIPKFSKGIKTPIDMAKYVFSRDHSRNAGQNETFRTAKSCSGFLNYFKHSIPLKFTCDIMLETYRNGNINYVSYDNSMKINIHSSDQITGHLSNDYIIVKFQYNILCQVKNNYVSFHTPIVYNSMPYEVCPGIVIENQMPNTLNVTTLFSKIDKTYYFKADQILGVMQFEKPISKIERVEGLAEKTKRHSYLLTRTVDTIINRK